MTAVSVIICTYNPRPDYLRRVIDALKAQTLPKEQWELLLIDNASKESLASSWDLSWHPRGRHLVEKKVGKNNALLQGFKEFSGEFLVIVDDDNVLNRDYLSEAISIFEQWPMLGAIGASIKAEFEIPPPKSIIPYLDGLAVCELERDYWANIHGWSGATPVGAGMCVRRNVVEDYVQKAASSKLRQLLGRSDKSMVPGEDLDLAWCAVDLGLGTGRFASLKVTHLISRFRLTEDYIVRLYAGFAGSEEILSFIRNPRPKHESFSWKKSARFLIEFLKTKGIQRRIFLASEKARNEARQLIAKHGMAP